MHRFPKGGRWLSPALSAAHLPPHRGGGYSRRARGIAGLSVDQAQRKGPDLSSLRLRLDPQECG